MLRGEKRRREGRPSAQMFAFAAVAALSVMSLSVVPLAAQPAEGSSTANGRVGPGAGYATMNGSLIQAYRNNPQLNSQRAATRAADENVPTALSGYRPRVAGTASSTESYLETLTKTNAAIGQPLPT